MSDWTGYVGMVTGIFGAVMGYLGYRRSHQIKVLDLRLELRKGLSDAHTSLGAIRGLMEDAARSHSRVLAARGLGGSGSMTAWENTFGADSAEVDQIAGSIRSEAADYAALSAEHLESELVAGHRVNKKLSALIDKYRGELAADDEARRQIARAHADAVNATRK
jgi:hypothetical protein